MAHVKSGVTKTSHFDTTYPKNVTTEHSGKASTPADPKVPKSISAQHKVDVNKAHMPKPPAAKK